MRSSPFWSEPCPRRWSRDEFKKRQAQILETEGEKGRAIVREFEERIKKENFVLAEIRLGPLAKNEVAPIVDGKPRTGDELEEMLAEGKISREEFERLDRLREQLGEELEEVMKHARDTERLVGEAMKALVFGFGSGIVNPRIDALKKRYPGERPSGSWSRCAITRSRTSRSSCGGRNPRTSRRSSPVPGTRTCDTG